MGFDIKGLLVILVIVIMIFGTKRLRGMGGDIGSAIKGFRSAMSKDDDKPDADKSDDDPQVLEHNSESHPKAESESRQPAKDTGHHS